MADLKNSEEKDAALDVEEKVDVRKQRAEARKRQIEEQKRIKINMDAAMKKYEKEPCAIGFAFSRILAVISVFMLLFPSANPTRVSGIISNNISILTSAISFSSLTSKVGVGFRFKQVTEASFYMVMVAAILLLLAIIVIGVANCVSLGNIRMKHLSFGIQYGGIALLVAGIIMSRLAYNAMLASPSVEFALPMLPFAFYIFIALAVVYLILTVVLNLMIPKNDTSKPYEMDTRFKLFIMFIPFALLTFVFCYLPLWGWRYAFFDYSLGDTLTLDKWNNFKWFTYLFKNKQTTADILQVITNTLAMSGLGILTSWIPMIFAIMLTEITNAKFKKVVQTFTTIPNFISWILVYTVALAIFSTDGFINSFAKNMGWILQGTNYMYGDSLTWLKMLAWGLWKGTGWSAIIYIAGISGIDRQLYEAATVDGANRFQRIVHVTLPGLLPTYMVMLLMAVAGCLSNGLDQYLVFSNASNMTHMNVLDLYVYNLGIGDGSGNIPLSTVIGMAKSIISVVLLFMANSISKVTRGESIV